MKSRWPPPPAAYLGDAPATCGAAGKSKSKDRSKSKDKKKRKKSKDKKSKKVGRMPAWGTARTALPCS